MTDSRSEPVPLAALRAALAHRPRRLYVWDVPPLRTGGVSDDAARAALGVLEALRDAPAGAEGTVRRVALGMQCDYVDLGEVGRARRAADGQVVWWPTA
ncbi:hypothetical protein [Actinomadura sp. 9N407]|uniref:hypothetical protein n=1 Tax=Actinomadura sp. 9N407 TaxID=3375154 RepID=UPI00379815FB